VELDELAEAFRDKAVVDRDVASGVLLTKIHERRATLLGLNAPAAAAVHIIEHQRPTLRPPTDRVEAAINRIRDQRLPAPRSFGQGCIVQSALLAARHWNVPLMCPALHTHRKA